MSAQKVTYTLQPLAVRGFVKPPCALALQCLWRERKERALPAALGGTGALLEGSSSSPRDGRELKQAKLQSSSSARGKGNFLSPP